jgi:flagellar hook-associated protein 3 FlgL
MRVDPNYVQNLTAAVDQSTSQEETLTTQLSSGLRVGSLQDDPVAVAQSILFGTSISNDDTFVQTASNESSKLQATDSVLGEVVSLANSAIGLSVEGNDGTLNSGNAASIAQQLSGIRDQVLTLANTNFQGQYLFGGSQGSTAPFTLDSTTNPATAVYNGDTNLQFINTPTGQQIQANLPGSAVFGSGGTGVLGALNQLISDISGGAATATITADTSALTTAVGQLSSQRSTIDSSLNRLQSTSTYIQTQEGQLKVAQSTLVQADPVAVATQLSTAETQHQAILSVISALSNNDLFSFLGK